MIQVFLCSFVKNRAGHDPKEVTVLMDIWLETIDLTLPSYYAESKHNSITDSRMTRPKTAS